MRETNRRERPPKDRSSVVWIISFLLLMASFYWLDQNSWFQETIVERLSRWTAMGTVFLLKFLGLQLKLADSTITGPGLRVEIAKSCSGTFVFLMFAAAVIPFPVPWKARLKGLLMGLGTLLLINLLRTSLIVLVVSRFPGALWTFHIVIGQVMVIVAMMGIFLWWAKGSHEKTFLTFFSNNRAIVRALLLFCVGYVAGYILYQIFLKSPLGLFVNKQITIHLEWILSFITAHFLEGRSTSFAPVPVNLVGGCLSSPVVVLLAAVVFAWPARWWKRLLVIFLGFLPFFYCYHLLRAVLVSLTLGFQSKDINLVYNFYGQVFLILFMLGSLAYVRCTRQKVMTYGKYLPRSALACLLALPVAFGVGWLSNHGLTPWLVGMVSDATVPAFDPEQAVSTMPAVWTFIWLALVGSTPHLTTARKIVFSLAGVLAVFILYAGIVMLFETFHMAPHKGLLKLFVILLPFGVYGAWFLPLRKAQR